MHLGGSRAQSCIAGIALGLCACAGSDRAEPTSTEAEPVTDPPSEVVEPGDGVATLLAELRRRLDEVARHSDSDEPFQNGGDLDVAPLAGLVRARLRNALGEPSTCADASGQVLQMAPCRAATDWFYSFYKLPENWVGGGPELLLQFDGERCTSAAWRYTQ